MALSKKKPTAHGLTAPQLLYLTIIMIIPLFTLGSVHSTNASEADQMRETNNSN